MKKDITTNQSGASAIMFAMVFIVVISLISLGFATLSRRDQRASLDKNISQEAQLVAESAVNSVKQYINESGEEILLDNSDCDPRDSIQGYSKPEFSTEGEITCLTWTREVDYLEKTMTSDAGYWSFEDKKFEAPMKLTIDATRGNGGAYSGGTAGNRRDLPSGIDGTQLPIIKVTTVDVGSLSDTASPNLESFYLIPVNKTSTSATAIDLGDGSSINNDRGNASAFGIGCSDSGICQVVVNGFPNPVNGSRLVAIQLIGGNGATTITYDNGSTSQITGVQVEVDATVKINDQTKRIVSRFGDLSAGTVTTQTQSWQPWFAVITDSLCKDIKVDGNNNTGIINTSTACPNN